MTDFELLTLGVFIGCLIAMFFIGVGVIIEDVRHYFDDKGKLDNDPADDTCICKRIRSRSCIHGCDKGETE